MPPVAVCESNSVVAEKETVIVFDWDDTLLSSTFLSSLGLRLDSDRARVEEHSAALSALANAVIALLNQALTYGPVTVITNAETGWVQLSAAKFIPAVVPYLAKLHIVSARSTYEAMFPDSPLKWKFHAFTTLLQPVWASKRERNILSFGDSHVEREACRAATRGQPMTRTKSVKFAERPSVEQLRRQVELVTNCFEYIFNHCGDLDLQLTVTVNANDKSAQLPVGTQQQVTV